MHKAIWLWLWLWLWQKNKIQIRSLSDENNKNEVTKICNEPGNYYDYHTVIQWNEGIIEKLSSISSKYVFRFSICLHQKLSRQLDFCRNRDAYEILSLKLDEFAPILGTPFLIWNLTCHEFFSSRTSCALVKVYFWIWQSL